MSNITRLVLFAFHATALLIFFSSPLASINVAASPLSQVSSAPSTHRSPSSTTLTSPTRFRNRGGDFQQLFQRRDILASSENGLLALLGLLRNQYILTQTRSQKLRKLDETSPTAQDDNYQQQCASELGGLHSNLLDLLTLLRGFLDAGHKGLANYDQKSGTETMLKDLVNAVKYTLRDTCNLGLVESLRPVCEVVKCAVDETLNAIENGSDKLINSMNLGI